MAHLVREFGNPHPRPGVDSSGALPDRLMKIMLAFLKPLIIVANLTCY